MYVHEIFESISGECSGLHQGILTTFIRLSGCNCFCSYCDSKHTQTTKGSALMSVREVLEAVESVSRKVVCITGGEPLLQLDELIILCRKLKDRGYRIILETNGTIDPRPLFTTVDSVVMDYKFEYKEKMDLNRFLMLRSKDVIKFVVSLDDLKKAIKIQELLLHNLDCHAMFAYSPIMDWKTDMSDVKFFTQELIKQNKNDCIFSLQIHKLLGVR